uniref:Uncharacterized protein n=1 Tax=Rhizophora mucronata TaxID=61149 RepID=A0A2P2NX75_RHIMU
MQSNSDDIMEDYWCIIADVS